MWSFGWSGRSIFLPIAPPGRHDVPAGAGWHTRVGMGVLLVARRSCKPHSRTVCTASFWDMIIQLFFLCQQLFPWRSFNPSLEVHWQMTLGKPTACRADTTLETDVFHITGMTQLPSSGRIKFPLWITNIVISAFQGKALTATQLALPVHYSTGR